MQYFGENNQQFKDRKYRNKYTQKNNTTIKFADKEKEKTQDCLERRVWNPSTYNLCINLTKQEHNQSKDSSNLIKTCFLIFLSRKTPMDVKTL